MKPGKLLGKFFNCRFIKEKRRKLFIGAACFKMFILLIFPAFVCLNAQNVNNLQVLLKVDSLARNAVITAKTAGLSLTIASDGKFILSKGYGYADLQNEIPARSTTIYPIASITKQFTAASILQLAERGKLSLEDSLSKFIPDYPLKEHNVTIHQLLNHTSGIKNITSLGEKYWRQIGNVVTPEDLIEMFSSEPFDFTPGEDYSYSNSDYILLGVIIEKISGLSYGEYLEQNIFKPFKLSNTFYFPDIKDTSMLAKPYTNRENVFYPATYVHPTQGYSMGGICSTSEDMTRWLTLLHSGEIIGSIMYRKMITPETLNAGERISYGYGTGVGELSGHKLLFHAGGIFGSDVQSVYFPAEKLSVVILANTDNAGVVELENRISKLLLGVTEAPEVKLDDIEKIKFTGTYKFRAVEIRISVNNDSLFISGLWGTDPVRLKYIGENSFSAEGQLELLRFIEKENKITKMRLEHYNARIADFIKAD